MTRWMPPRLQYDRSRLPVYKHNSPRYRLALQHSVALWYVHITAFFSFFSFLIATSKNRSNSVLQSVSVSIGLLTHPQCRHTLLVCVNSSVYACKYTVFRKNTHFHFLLYLSEKKDILSTTSYDISIHHGQSNVHAVVELWCEVRLYVLSGGRYLQTPINMTP